MLSPALGTNAYEFFQGGIASVVPLRRSVSLNGYEYAIDTKLYARQSQDTLRQYSVQTGQVDDRLFDANGAWSRYRSTWHHGAGQQLADLREDADPYRFLSSAGVDPWTQNELRLLPAGTLDQTITATGAQLVVCNGSLFIGAGTTLTKYTAGAGYTMYAATNPILSMTSDGIDLYVATSAGLTKYPGGADASTAFAPTAVVGSTDKVAFVSNRLLAAQGASLYEVASTGALTLIRKHYQPGFRWTTIFSIGSRIYIGGFAGTRSEIISVTTDSVGNLVGSQEAAVLLPGELLRDGIGYAGAALIATSSGVRLAQLGSDGTLNYGALIKDVGDTRCLTGEGSFVWCGWSKHPSGGSGLARLSLSVFTDPLVPAFASDIAETDTPGTVVACARYGGHQWFIVDGVGLYRDDSIAVEKFGRIDAGQLYHGTIEDKGVSSLIVKFAALKAGQKIRCLIYDENGILITSRTADTIDATSLLVDSGAVVGGWVRVVIELYGNGLTSPVLHLWHLRAWPVVPPVEVWIVPIILASRVDLGLGEGQDHSYQVLDEVERIVEWWRSKQAIVYREGQRGYRVRIDAYKLDNARWNDEGRFFESILTLQMISA